MDPDHPDDPWMPGEVCDADCQCQAFYLDRQSRAVTGQGAKICDSVYCESDNKPGGTYRVGPALEGTECGDRKWCHDGSCVQARSHKGRVKECTFG